MWPLRPLRGHISYTVGSRAAAKRRWWRRLWPMTLPFPLPLPPPPLQPQNFQRWDFLVLVQPRISNGRTFQNPCSPGVQRPVLRHVVCMIRLIKKVDRKKKLQKMLPWASFSFDRKPRCAMSAPLWLPAFPFPFICGFMGTHCRLLQFARVCICSSGGRRRPYRVECTGSLSTSEVKQHRARLVLGWGTAWEDLWVLSACCTTKKRQGTS